MSFNTTYPGEIVIANNATNLVYGTAMLGDAFGKVLSASVARDADKVILEAQGSILAVVLRNPSFAFKFKVIFSADVDPPGLGDLVTFPLAGIQGRVWPGASIEWEEKGHRQLSLEVSSWDSFAATNQGAGSAYSYEGGVYTPMT